MSQHRLRSNRTFNLGIPVSGGLVGGHTPIFSMGIAGFALVTNGCHRVSTSGRCSTVAGVVAMAEEKAVKQLLEKVRDSPPAERCLHRVFGPSSGSRGGCTRISGVAYTMPYAFAPCLPDLKDSEAPKQQGLRELRQGGPFRPRRRLCQVFDLHMPHLQERPPELLAPLQGKHEGL